MFLGCSPCCDSCPDITNFPDASGFFIRFSAHLVIAGYFSTDFDSGTQEITAGEQPFGSYATLGTSSDGNTIAISTLWQQLGNLRQYNFTLLSTPSSFRRVFLEFRQAPCFAAGAYDRKKNSLGITVNAIGDSNSFASNVLFSVHDGEVNATSAGSTNLATAFEQAISNTRTLTGDRVRSSSLNGHPGSLPWQLHVEWKPTSQSTASLDFKVLEIGATDDGNGSSLLTDYVHFGDTAADIELA